MIGDNILIGVNFVIFEGVKIGKGLVVVVGFVVIEDVLEGVVVVGLLVKIIKFVDDKIKDKI